MRELLMLVERGPRRWVPSHGRSSFEGSDLAWVSHIIGHECATPGLQQITTRDLHGYPMLDGTTVPFLIFAT